MSLDVSLAGNSSRAFFHEILRRFSRCSHQSSSVSCLKKLGANCPDHSGVGSTSATIFTAVEQSCALKLEARKRPSLRRSGLRKNWRPSYSPIAYGILYGTARDPVAPPHQVSLGFSVVLSSAVRTAHSRLSECVYRFSEAMTCVFRLLEALLSF